MDQIVKNTTERLLRKLNPEQPFYTPSDMLEAGFPAFVVERIRLELETNLADSIVPPNTDWAIMNAEEVTGAWQQFLDAIHNQLRLPNSFAKGVIESSVADMVDILTEPRKNLPDYLFVSTDDLHQEEIEERIRWVVVYPHFASFLPRYMKAKKLDKISKERYAKAIAQIDDKLSARYSPLNWAQVLKPLFSLCNGELEPEILSRFFHDKNMDREAKRFEKFKDPVDDHQLIEVLSRADFNEDYENEFLPTAAYAEPQAETAKNDPEAETEAVKDEEEDTIIAKLKPQDEDEIKNEADIQDESEEDENEETEKPLYSTLLAADDDEDEDDELPEELKDKRRTTIIDAPEEDSDDEDDVPEVENESEAETEEEDDDDGYKGYTPLHSHWAGRKDKAEEEKGYENEDEDDDDERNIAISDSQEESLNDEEEDDDSSYSPLYARFQQASDSEDDDDEPLSPDDFRRDVQDYETDKKITDEADLTPRPSDSVLRRLDDDDVDDEEITAPDDETSDDDDEPFIPLWQRLSVSDDEDEPGIAAVPAEEEETTHRRETIENPKAETDMAQKLAGYLKNDQKLYVREIFNNDEAAYNRALRRLADFRTWREAGKFLTNDIFRKNGIDMYKDVTVDFTDRLHKFFTDNMRR